MSYLLLLLSLLGGSCNNNKRNDNSNNNHICDKFIILGEDFKLIKYNFTNKCTTYHYNLMNIT